MKRVLVDSNIFLDYYLDRRDNFLPLGEFAAQFINRAVKCEYFILVCNATIWEVSSNLKISEKDVWGNILGELKKKNKVEIASYSHEQVKEARKISKDKHVAFNDALFAVIARDSSIVLVTRDNHFFVELSGIADAVKPEDLE